LSTQSVLVCSSNMPPVFAYWNIRAVGQPIRMLLEYSGQEYEDKTYFISLPLGPDSKKEWHQVRDAVGLDFPNLPYYIDGNVKLTNSSTIIRYIANKHNLAGRTEEEKAKVDMLYHTAYDIFWSEFLPLVKSDKSIIEIEKPNFVSGQLIVHLNNLSKYLGNKKFFFGDHVTYADFFLNELLLSFSHFATEVFNKYPTLKQFLHSIEELPAIAKFMKTEKYIKYYATPFIGM